MPTMPNNSQWVAAWKALTITGVTNKTTPPKSLANADLPAGWPELPEASLNNYVVSCVGNNKRRMMVFQIAISPLGVDSQAANYDATVALMDNIETAVDGLRGSLVNWVDYTVEMTTTIFIGKTAYWGLRVTAVGRNTQ